MDPSGFKPSVTLTWNPLNLHRINFNLHASRVLTDEFTTIIWSEIEQEYPDFKEAWIFISRDLLGASILNRSQKDIHFYIVQWNFLS